MKTDYTNCNQDIADSLKRGEHIRCYIIEDTKAERKRTIIAYLNGCYVDGNLNKIQSNKCSVRLVATETYIIDAVSMMKGLAKRRYKVDTLGYWSDGVGNSLAPIMWFRCGKTTCAKYTWEDWMLEEREV